MSSDQTLLVESILYLISIGVEITPQKILYATALLGSDNLIGDRLNQIRHYVKVSRRRSLPAKEMAGLSSAVDQISLRIPGVLSSISRESELRGMDTCAAMKLFGELRLNYFQIAKNWIISLSGVKEQISNVMKFNRRSIDLLDQSIRLIKGLLLSDEKARLHDKFFYFQFPIFYENRISTIEGRIDKKSEKESGTDLDMEAIWRRQGENIAYFHLSRSNNLCQADIKSRSEQLASLIKMELADFFTLSDNENETHLSAELDGSFMNKINGLGLMWPLSIRKNQEVDLIV